MTKELKRTPDMSYRLGVLYDQDINSGELNLSVVLNHEDEYFTNQNNTPSVPDLVQIHGI